MKTKTNLLALPFALLLSLAVTGCPSSDDSSGTPGRGGASGHGGAPAQPGQGRATSCVYEYSTEFLCSGSQAPSNKSDPDIRCDNNSECGYLTVESERAAAFPECRSITYRENQRVYEVTCDEYRAIVDGGGKPPSPECAAALDLRRCSECARNRCCDEMATCANSAECVGYLACAYACDDRFSATAPGGTGDEEALSTCRKKCFDAHPEANAKMGPLRGCQYLSDCGCGAL
jgi:hypothetical protein